MGRDIPSTGEQMLHIPQIPPWESLHPLVIHFPIVLLLVSPVFVLVSTVLAPTKGRPYLIVGLALLLGGTAGLFIATETGEAAAELADRTPQIDATLHVHEELASQTRLLFSLFSAFLIAVSALPRLLPRPLTRLQSTSFLVIFLALYSTGVAALVNTAHQGGRLVHQFGVRAMMPADPGAPSDASGEHGE
jgi:uncharacterized membrane protein